MSTDAELRDQALAELRLTTVGYKNKNWQTPPPGTHWANALGLLAQIGASPPPAPAPARTRYTLTLAPNYNNGDDGNDVANNYNAVWLFPGPAIYSPPNGKDPYAVLLLDPRATDRNGKPGVDEWWFQIRVGWPAVFDFTRHGKFGTLGGNAHNVAGDSGPAGTGGVGWSFGSGVSAFEMIWLPGTAAPSMHFENAKSGGLDVPLPVPTRDELHIYDVRFRAGRTDGTTVRPGGYEVWADGQFIAKDDNVNTVQRAQGPDGNWYVQKWMAVPWPGYYTQDLDVRSTVFFEMPGVGMTREEAAASTCTVAANTFDTQKWNGRLPNMGAPALEAS